jgi:hypothetical protein
VQQLQIRLDEQSQAQQVAEIVDSEYFQDLQARTQSLRKIVAGE